LVVEEASASFLGLGEAQQTEAKTAERPEQES